jgi:16S rRNA processing protein RimM
VLRPQGRRGEVAAELHTDFPERFRERRRLFALDKDGHRRELRLEDFWPHKGLIVLKFAGVDSISAAEGLAGWEIQIPRSQRAPLEPGSAYVADLIGCRVAASVAGAAARELGTIAEVQFGAGDAPLLIIRGDQEYLVPLAEEYLARLDVEHKRVEMKLPQGMLDLDAPLTREEKERQS